MTSAVECTYTSDLMCTAEFFSFFIEQSFLTHGYREANLVSAAMKP